MTGLHVVFALRGREDDVMTGLHVVFALRGREDDVTGRKLFTSLRLEHADTVTDAVSRTLSFHSSSLPHAVN